MKKSIFILLHLCLYVEAYADTFTIRFGKGAECTGFNICAISTGPKSTSDLQKILSSDQNSVITSLSSSTKQSLITYMQFDGVRFRGMTTWDDNITKLMSGNYIAVMEEILQAKVITNSLPVLRNYDVVIQNGGTGLLGVCSMCTSCPPFSGQGPHGCCNVDKGECCDIINPNIPPVYKQ